MAAPVHIHYRSLYQNPNQSFPTFNAICDGGIFDVNCNYNWLRWMDEWRMRCPIVCCVIQLSFAAMKVNWENGEYLCVLSILIVIDPLLFNFPFMLFCNLLFNYDEFCNNYVEFGNLACIFGNYWHWFLKYLVQNFMDYLWWWNILITYDYFWCFVSIICHQYLPSRSI